MKGLYASCIGSKSDQKGAALLVSLVFLIVLTMLGITSMRGANMEEKMAANTMFQNMSFQASESAVDYMLDSISTLTQSINNPDIATYTIPMAPNGQSTAATSSAQVRYLNQSTAEGYSVDKFMNYQFEIVGTGEVVSANSTSVTSQGVYRIAPTLQM